MKDNDTHKLEGLYDSIGGVRFTDTSLISESVEGIEEFLTEGFIDGLGQRNASLLVGLFKRHISACNGNPECESKFEDVASDVVERIRSNKRGETAPEVLANLRTVGDMGAVATIKYLYSILSM